MTLTSTPAKPLDHDEVEAIRADFPILHRTVGDGAELVYLDSGATSQRPRQVLQAEYDFASTSYSAVHRGAHTLASEATDAFEAARETVARFVGIPTDGVVWTRNATEGLNVLAAALTDPESGQYALKPGDEVLVTEMEHHANLVPWQRAAARSGATLRWIPLTDAGRLDLSGIDGPNGLINERTKVVAFAHASNVLGTINPVAQLVAKARAVGALTILDACQSVPHLPVDLSALGVDAAVFSGHKMLGPTGIGVLAARPGLLDALPPVLTGGSMVERVTMETATFREAPQRFEAGTPPVAQAVALRAAVDYLDRVGMDRIAAREHQLAQLMLDGVHSVAGVRVIGPNDAEDRTAMVAFEVEGVHPHDVGQVLDAAGVAVRVGHHCAQPVHRRFGVNASSRASAYLYTTDADVERFVEALGTVRGFFGRS
ncbi:SufS family cysteine desulfurase [Kineosporia sp. NBRC 101731]|uniref:SufS family cysteine desulfurase n=1 Tax=Kineosporia sp. NBRC 101731 TaxID=3032199 RepID=UPI0024A29D4E|nr:SufS family cysteine desulfurase [Kineosporia sp. NBRC 101731]GLY31659.1 cysteine desulfurase [Kineosporia sp. NBRC 101731]